ncbi:MAG: hypothetical protein J1F40_02460 [Prevotellaceae bacterium]|nr:hypothetical protein [Prevotellaceae bacterium]
MFYYDMINKLFNIWVVVIKIWHFVIGLSGIISCIFAGIGCYIAYVAMNEVYNFKIEITPIIEKLRKDSVVIIERPAPILIRDSISRNTTVPASHEKKQLGTDDSSYLSSDEINKIRNNRDEFLKKMHLFFEK